MQARFNWETMALGLQTANWARDWAGDWAGDWAWDCLVFWGCVFGGGVLCGTGAQTFLWLPFLNYGIRVKCLWEEGDERGMSAGMPGPKMAIIPKLSYDGRQFSWEPVAKNLRIELIAFSNCRLSSSRVTICHFCRSAVGTSPSSWPPALPLPCPRPGSVWYKVPPMSSPLSTRWTWK